MREGFSASDHYTVSTRRGILVDIMANSIDDLLSGIRESNEPGDPDQVENLWLAVSTNTSEDPESSQAKTLRKITLDVSSGGVALSILGDPAWARGKVDHLTALINETRPFRSFIWGLSSKWFAFVGSALAGNVFMACMMISGAMPVKFIQDKQTPGMSLAILASFLIGAWAGWSLGISIKRHTRTTVWILDSPPPPSRWRMSGFETVSIIVSILALLAAIFSGYASYESTDSQETVPSNRSTNGP